MLVAFQIVVRYIVLSSAPFKNSFYYYEVFHIYCLLLLFIVSFVNVYFSGT